MPTPNAPPDAAVDRFRADWTALAGASGGNIGVAVSGGVDSLALLLLAHNAFPGRVSAATIDHGMRPESADEARFVASVCATLDIPHYTARIAMPATGNRQAMARRARYDALLAWVDAAGLDWLATAHHADDQVETVVMRLNRGSGVAGLAGIRARDDHIVRPLLGWVRSELEGVVRARGLVPVDDPSNSDVRYDRARLRKALAGTDWLDPRAVVRATAALHDADVALSHYRDREYDAVVTDGNGQAVIVLAKLFDLPREIQRRVVLRLLDRLDPGLSVRESALQTGLAALHDGGRATIGDWLFATQDEFGLVCRAPPRRGSE